jgi:hypothetical protein
LDLDKQNQELREELEVVKGALTTIKMEKLAPSKGIPDVKAQANKRIF